MLLGKIVNGMSVFFLSVYDTLSDLSSPSFSKLTVEISHSSHFSLSWGNKGEWKILYFCTCKRIKLIQVHGSFLWKWVNGLNDFLALFCIIWNCLFESSFNLSYLLGRKLLISSKYPVV